MNGMRHRPALRPGRSGLLISSVLALLTLAFFPVAAQADSSGTQYEDALPSPYGEKSPPHKEGPAKSSSAPNNGGASAPSSSGSSKSGAGSSSEDPSSKSNNGGGVAHGADGTGQGNQGNGSTGVAKTGVQPLGQAATKETGSEDGGSSPLVPILIAVLVLAAISLGVVMARQRRQRRDSGASVAPRAS